MLRVQGITVAISAVTILRGLSLRVDTGDIVGLDTTYGRFHYRITQRYITSGTDRSYIDHPRSGTGEVLELVTCWPLWQGAFAPDRLVFEATPVNVQ